MPHKQHPPPAQVISLSMASYHAWAIRLLETGVRAYGSPLPFLEIPHDQPSPM